MFTKIPKGMIDSFHTRNNRSQSFDNTDSYFSNAIPRSRQLAESRETFSFHRSSLISSFSKANLLRFVE